MDGRRRKGLEEMDEEEKRANTMDRKEGWMEEAGRIEGNRWEGSEEGKKKCVESRKV